MLNFKTLKYALLLALFIPGLFLLIMLINSFTNQPKIINLGNIKIDEIISNNSQSVSPEMILDNQNGEEFAYKLIGVRFGGINSSVVVKKANKEYLVSVGEMLDDRFELIEVTKESALFRNGQKVYKINSDEKNWNRF